MSKLYQILVLASISPTGETDAFSAGQLSEIDDYRKQMQAAKDGGDPYAETGMQVIEAAIAEPGTWVQRNTSDGAAMAACVLTLRTEPDLQTMADRDEEEDEDDDTGPIL